MRHPEIAPEFASCLHYFMTNLEQTRGGRNANYKQMNMTNMSKAMSYNRLGNFLSSKGALLMRLLNETANLHDFHFHWLIVDWYSIAGQMPHLHRRFQDSPGALALLGRGGNRHGGQPGQAPPWRVGRLPG